MTKPPAIFQLSARSSALAAKLVDQLPGAEIHAPREADCPADIRFTEPLDHLRALYGAKQPIIGLCASAILIRAVASVLADKHEEPPLIAVDEAGINVVPLLGGHRGANALALTIAGILDAHPAITTASDQALGIALDEPPSGWRLTGREHVKSFASKLMNGTPTLIEDPLGLGAWLRAGTFERSTTATLSLAVTHQRSTASPNRLVYHPPVLALGVGCERGIEPGELTELVEKTLSEHGLAVEAIACLVSLDLKAAEPAIHALAQTLQVPARFFSKPELLREAPRLATPSAVVEAEVGVPGVAEAAALAAAGPNGQLLVPKQKSRRATCAIALAPQSIDGWAIGRARGRLRLVGLGPGTIEMRTSDATKALQAADMLVGYGLYLDLAGPAFANKEQRRFPLGAEKERCTFALDQTAQGRDVALLCSGDPGIYAMAALVLELVEHSDDPAWHRVEVEMIPGVSAMQAASARIGAPLGHDFAVISLSDLMTPWEVIEQRLHAAAKGDFVLALYNPVSQRRRTALVKARDILLNHRPKNTPVMIGRNLGRPDERMDVIELADLQADAIDMLTVVLIGSSTTRRFDRPDGGEWVYTPRGYEVR